ncbi:hypothetical protein B0H66DRAFT_323025 [Apodospora peruviana]|uniref:Early meiotic induction protein 1 n=1 Tax=Apodospora peruviana TaxID=516989 RepID=A0AAE0HXW7_9PEZI|nr:hypothetical protein B0H66DRAFT_323025 [Apodospora peruviana]
MGWFWQSSPSSGSSSPSEQQPTQTAAGPPPPPPPPPPLAKLSEEEMFLKMLMDEAQPKPQQSNIPPPPPPPPSSVPKPTAKTSSITSYLPFSAAFAKLQAPPQPEVPEPERPTRSPASIAMSEHSLPVHMSCRDAFDYAWHCHTPGSQFNSVYRYGSVRNCTELWDDFWFCMRTRSYTPEHREEAIKEHYRKKEAAKYDGRDKPSSEDIWESRDDRVPVGSVFNAEFGKPPPAASQNDTEWQRFEIERRRRIRREMGIEDDDKKQ